MDTEPAPPSTRGERAIFHRGEVAVQSRAGKAERMQQIGGQVIRDFMPEQHRKFFAELPYLIYGALDAADQPWASLLIGKPGFVHSIDDAAPANRCNTTPGRSGVPVLERG